MTSKLVNFIIIGLLKVYSTMILIKKGIYAIFACLQMHWLRYSTENPFDTSFTPSEINKLSFGLGQRRAHSTSSVQSSTNDRDFAKGNPDKLLNPWYVTGITDGEGSFGISAIATKGLLGYRFSLQYKVTQKAESAGILWDLQRYFQCGSVVIDNREDNTLKFQVQSLSDIVNKVIPHFNAHPLVTSKALNYMDFRSVALMLHKGVPNSTAMIPDIKSGMNKGRLYDSKWNYLHHTLFTRKLELHPYWVLAFIDGESTFYVEMGLRGHNTPDGRRPSRNPYFAFRAGLEIAQSSHDVFVLDAIGQFFGPYLINPSYDISSMENAKRSRRVNRLKVRHAESIINFMDNHELLTIKALDYQDWKRLVMMFKAKLHLTESGRAQMYAIKVGMNRGRNKS
jgi:hypothetical protein